MRKRIQCYVMALCLLLTGVLGLGMPISVSAAENDDFEIMYERCYEQTIGVKPGEVSLVQVQQGELNHFPEAPCFQGFPDFFFFRFLKMEQKRGRPYDFQPLKLFAFPSEICCMSDNSAEDYSAFLFDQK